MLQFTYTPPIEPKRDEPLAQTIRLSDGAVSIGVARWYSASSGDGVAQLLELSVLATHRRTGNGRRILQATILQATEHYRARQSKLRRMWIAVEQKEQVIARAFLTQHGFHHVHTLPELLKGQDLLVYVRSFD